MSKWVLDASALLALLNCESGSERVAVVLPDAVISSINFSEVVAKLADEGRNQTEIRFYLDALGLTIVEFDTDLAYRAGFLRPLTRSIGLSFGDRACLALAASLGVPALTCDRA
ncbi:type II toxin-antitoxin system VapC family toxin [Leptolyngbya sp. AN03gr2]|uniref:type II toxin-antitoxin system VapC family toxin n=1 Tax=unclassified Leptolyngbya TaxID=2650499 RepID=UPI003D31E433